MTKLKVRRNLRIATNVHEISCAPEHITGVELRASEYDLLKICQRESFPEIVSYLLLGSIKPSTFF